MHHRFFFIQRIDRPSPLALGRTIPPQTVASLLGHTLQPKGMSNGHFETGNLARSFARFAVDLDRIQVVAREVTRRGVTRMVYFVCDPEYLDAIWNEWHIWQAQEVPHTCEPTSWHLYFNHINSLGDPTELHPVQHLTVAWWSLSEELVWTLDEMVAKTILLLLRTAAERDAIEPVLERVGRTSEIGDDAPARVST